MLLKIDHKKLKKRIYSQYNIRDINDFNSLKNYLKDKEEIFRMSYGKFFFLNSQFDYSNNIIIKSTNKFRKKKKVKNTYILKLLFKKFFNFLKKLKYELFSIFYSNNLKSKKNIQTIIISKHKLIDEINFIELSKKIRKNHLILFNNYETKKKYSSLYNKSSANIVMKKNIITILKGYYFFLKKRDNIMENFPLKNIAKEEIKNFYIDFFTELEFFKNTFKHIAPKNIISSSFIGNEALVYYFKYYRKINTKFIAYSIHGPGGDSCNYLFHLADILLVPGKIDKEIIDNCINKKLNLLKIPKVKIVGSVRHYHWLNFLKKPSHKKKGGLNILFICSNPIYFKKNIENISINYLIKFAKKNKNINFIIKERPRFKTNFYDQNLKNILVIDEENFFIEDLINISDICIGTSSSGIIRQALHQDKNVLQMFHNESYMLKLNQKVSIDNYFKFESSLKNIISDRNSFKYNSKELLSKNINPVKKITNLLNN